MNDTVINISGIQISHGIIDLQGSSDKAHILKIKGEDNKQAEIHICFGKITKVIWNE